MAKLCTALLAGLVLLTGCQQPTLVGSLPSPNFHGPAIAAPLAANPAPAAARPADPPKASRQPVAVRSSVPTEWIPANTARKWKWIVIHHSDTPRGGLVAFDRSHKAKGWDGVGYHFVIGNGTDTGNGQIEVGFRWREQREGAHTKTPGNAYNEEGIGICLVGNFEVDRPTSAQLTSLARLTAYLMNTYHIPADHVIGHRDAKATDCPGRNVDMAAVRRLAIQYTQQEAAGTVVRANVHR